MANRVTIGLCSYVSAANGGLEIGVSASMFGNKRGSLLFYEPRPLEGRGEPYRRRLM